MLKLGLCRGRHDIPGIEDYIFPGEVNPLDPASLEQEAMKVLLSFFPDYYIGITNLPNQADYIDIPVYLLGSVELYVTGLTVALVAALNACRKLGISVTLMHYDRESGSYYPQPIV